LSTHLVFSKSMSALDLLASFSLANGVRIKISILLEAHREWRSRGNNSCHASTYGAMISRSARRPVLLLELAVVVAEFVMPSDDDLSFCTS